MISKKALWETTAYRHFKGMDLKMVFRILGAKTPEEQDKCVKWMEDNGASIIKKFQKKEQQSDDLYNYTLELIKEP